MLKKRIIHILLMSLALAGTTVQAQTKTFVRDYNYRGESMDTAATCRINAIDGVKQELVNELGTYVESVVNVNEDSEGNSYMSHDVVTISAGITSLKVLKENWNKPVYYVKASMEADPQEVMKQVEALRNDLQLEKSLRESQEALEASRTEVAELKAQLATSGTNNRQLVANYMSAVGHMEVEQAFQRAAAARIQGNFVAAMKEFRSLAEQGNPRAQLRMGLFYERGLGVEQDYAEALQWFQKSMAGGNINAPAQIGWMYEHGRGVDKDYDKAAEYYHQSIKLGSHLGYAHMGYLYETGKGVELNNEKAAEYYRTASDMGNYLAMARLGYLYQAGLGVEQDMDKAVALYKEAAEHGQPVAMARLGQAYNLGLGGLEVDHKKGLSYIRGAVRYNLPVSYGLLGLAYDKGYGVKTDYKKAISWYEKAAKMDAPLAQLRLGVMYLKGIGVERNPRKARAYLQRSADLGNEKAQQILERMNRRMGNGF